MSKRNLKIVIAVIGVLFILTLLVAWRIVSIGQGHEEPEVPPGYDVIQANGHSFSVRQSGHKDSAAVILLHGFPESAAMWTRLIKDLNDEGYYTIAPNQRGYSAGARPKETEAYKMQELEQDVMALADALSIDRFHLIAHDWGSAVGWQLATSYSDRIISYSCMSVPHLGAFARAYEEDSLQFEASNYIRGFQTPWIPEFALARKDYKLMRSVWSEHSNGEIDAYLNLFRQKRALTSAINWYRANASLFEEKKEFEKIEIPVLFIWGNDDMALMRSGAEWTENYVDGYYRFVEMDAGHWLIQESFDSIQKEILQHLQRFDQ